MAIQSHQEKLTTFYVVREKNTGLSSYTFTRPKILASTPSHIMVNMVQIREETSECPIVDFPRGAVFTFYKTLHQWRIMKVKSVKALYHGSKFNFQDMFSNF